MQSNIFTRQAYDDLAATKLGLGAKESLTKKYRVNSHILIIRALELEDSTLLLFLFFVCS